MSHFPLTFPGWAEDVDMPKLTAYAGPEKEAVPWMGGTTRRTYRIQDERGGVVWLNMLQAVAVAETIIRDANRSIHVDH